MKTRFFSSLFTVLLAATVPSIAVTVGSPPAGGVTLVAGGARDSWLSLPLVRRAELTHRIASVQPSSLSLSGTPLVAGAYAPGTSGAYYAEFVTGNLAGLSYKIISNTTGAITLETLGDDLSAHGLGTIAVGTAGDLVRIRSFWTVGDVFGASGGSIDSVASLPTEIYTQADAILLPDNQTVGTEKAPGATIVYVAGQGWRQNASNADRAAAELPPGVPFVVRRQSSVAVSLLLVGYVAQQTGVIRLPALSAGGETDVHAALFQPATRRMADLGLATVIESAAAASSANDLFLSPSDVRGGFSIPPAQRLHLIGTNWYEGDAIADDQSVRFGSGFILRLRGERPVRYWRQVAN